ncbi:GTP cyclohydrolase I [Microlunatus phosphovorus NM-1]|uniref:GTP cyclohydrolase 1 n=1 Tax=Microlunatus phosphovorus (strain ATCC 700054 / DSM 10555 / JCM 9379 / NBRC 101784 / NCIMB 13414 / VKM Ac-1990 / NM-1) TaxID=1032480 RepID=F5XIE0_MICPN|nr:GTP cyclohydrolase I [Microlunatus phosphovorus NM-1]
MSRNGRSPGRAPGLLERNGFRPVVTNNRPAVDLAAAEQAAGLLLNALGLDLADENLAETPRRMAHALIEMTNGPNFELTTFPNDEGYDELVLVQNIAMQSVCEHHMLPFVGVAHVGYLPGSRILGLSKFARMVELHARRPQTQERLTKRIADHLQAELDPKGVGVVIEAEHTCMSLRGARNPRARTTTSAMFGRLRDEPRSRAEFLALTRSQR